MLKKLPINQLEEIFVSVSEADIIKARTIWGQPSRFCAIAQAARRMYNGLVSVGGSTMLIDGNMFDLPIQAREFICHFDAGHDVKPIDFIATKMPEEIVK